jgi:Recombination endonuclease VII
MSPTEETKAEKRDRAKYNARKRREWHNMTPEHRDRLMKKRRAAKLMARYGITVEDYDSILASQDGVCALCFKTPEQTKSQILCVDHCHDTGVVRGLLCRLCNYALAALGDEAEHLRRAVAYLER